jgi:UDP:flavonoid glycosyltransferase YjiC (YdhE family)
MRAGVPTLILWEGADQPIWAAQVKRLKIGSGRRFATTTRKSLTAELRSVLSRHHVMAAKDFATRMTKPADSVAAAADLLEGAARPAKAGFVRQLRSGATQPTTGR